MESSPPRTLFAKVWDEHVVVPETTESPAILYIDLHLVHEVTSPQAFAELRRRGRKVRSPERVLATLDHSTPTLPAAADGTLPYGDAGGAAQVATLERNAREFGLHLHGFDSSARGVIHVMGPELGATHPGSTVVCGDSHTSTHGAFGALAFGIGTSEVAHVLATQCLWQRRPRTMQVELAGTMPPGCAPKDLALLVVASLGADGGAGHTIEFTGEAVRALSMEGRMTLCNMAIEAGARSGMVAPDEKTLRYLAGRPWAPRGAEWERSVERWQHLATDPVASYDAVRTIDVGGLTPMITYGTNPALAMGVDGAIPDPGDDPRLREALAAMGFHPGEELRGRRIDVVFIGSCTNARIEDLRAAAAIMRGRTVAPGTRVLVVPGSGAVKQRAEEEGLAAIFTRAGAEWREPGCSMCIAMNGDHALPGEYVVSTSNRNFAGRQGPDTHTILASPATAAAAAVTGRLTDPRELSGVLQNYARFHSRPFAPGGVAHPPSIHEYAPSARLARNERSGNESHVFSEHPTETMELHDPPPAGVTEPLRTVHGPILLLPEEDIDTDQIIPARFLTTTVRTGLGRHAFADWRNKADGSPREDCALNDPRAAGCSILVAGRNFGCGSSREHAPWTLLDRGLRAVISPAIADIFRSNALRNGLLPVVVSPATHARLVARPWAEVEVDLERCVVVMPEGDEVPFPVDPFARRCLLEGTDELGILLEYEERIAAFERARAGGGAR